MKSQRLAQNFLRNRRTARLLAHLAGPDSGATCVDLGAGNGMITEAALRRSGPVVAVELDPRLVVRLRERFAGQPRVTVVEADLTTAPIPDEPFVIAANPPFNQSTVLTRRWLLAPTFASGALIVEKPFAGRVSGTFGATKLSLSFAPYVEMATGPDVSPEAFSPRPWVPTAILVATRRQDPLVPWDARFGYWRFVNYLFERSQRTVGDALQPLQLPRLPASLRAAEVRELDVEAAVDLYAALRTRGPGPTAIVAAFEASLPHARRVRLGEVETGHGA